MDNRLGPLCKVVDLSRYQGLWYELVRSKGIPFEPPGTTDVTARYSYVDNNFSILNRARIGGQPVQWEAKVERINNQYNSEFTLNSNMGRATYRILALGKDYDWAVVSNGEDNKMVWVLSRTPRRETAFYQELFPMLSDHFGVDPKTLEYTVHTEAPTTAVSGVVVSRRGEDYVITVNSEL